MCHKIRCDGKSWKLFAFQAELNKALVIRVQRNADTAALCIAIAITGQSTLSCLCESESAMLIWPCLSYLCESAGWVAIAIRVTGAGHCTGAHHFWLWPDWLPRALAMRCHYYQRAAFGEENCVDSGSLRLQWAPSPDAWRVVRLLIKRPLYVTSSWQLGFTSSHARPARGSAPPSQV